MEVEEKSLEDKFDKQIQELMKNKTIKSIESIYDFLKENAIEIKNNKVIPFDLSKKLISFIKDNVISVEITIKIFKLFIDAFIDMKNFPDNEIINFREIIKDIFIIASKIYDSLGIKDFADFLEKYFNKYYPKDNNIKHQVGDVVDVLINDTVFDKKILGWTQLPIKEIDEEKKLYIFDNPSKKDDFFKVNYNMYQIQEKNTFIKEEEVEWKNNLKVNDVVDLFNYNKGIWAEGYIKEVNDSGYLIQPIGEPESAFKIKTFSRYSPFIQPLLKFSYKYDPEDKACFTIEKISKPHHPYRYFLPVTENNYTVPYDKINKFSMEYYDVLNYFIIKIIKSNVLMDESISLIFLFNIITFIKHSISLINSREISKYIKEKCFEHIKNVLNKYSLSKQKIVNVQYGWKTTIATLNADLDLLLGHYDYLFNRFYYVPEFFIKFGYNCFKYSENLEKRHLGLSEICAILPYIKTYYPIIGKKSKNKLTEFINNCLLNIDKKDDIITLLYSNLSIHEELLSKGNYIISSISELKLLTDKHIEHLYNLAINTHENSEPNKYIYSLLNKIIENFSLNQKEFIFIRIINIPYEKLRKSDIEIVKILLKDIESKEIFLKMAKSFLDYYYNYITEFKKYDTSYNEDFGKIISFAKDSENSLSLYKIYFKQLLEETKKQNNLEKYRYYFTLIHSIFNSLYYLDNNNSNVPIIKEELKKIFFENYSDVNIIVDKSLELYNMDKSEKNEDYLKDVFDIVNGFINRINEKKYFTIDSIIKLADLFIFNGKSNKNRMFFIYNIMDIKNYDFDFDKLYERLFEKISHYLDKITLDNPGEYLDNEFLFAILSLYELINKKDINKKDKSTMEIFNMEKNKFLEKKNPFENKYFDIMWKMFYKSKSTDKIKNFLIDFSLKNFNQKERFEIWNKLVQKIFDNLENNILIGLTMLEFIVRISEKYGNARAKSHICDLYSNEYKKQIRLSFNTTLKDFVNFENKLSQNKKEMSNDLNVSSTIWDIKYMLQETLGYDPIIQKISKADYIEIIDESLPLFKIFPNVIDTDEEEVNVNLQRNNIVYCTPVYPLLSDENNELNDKFIEVIFNIFNQYSENNILSSVNFAKFIKNIYSPLNKTQYEMENIYIQKYNAYSNNKGYLDMDDFLLYFANLAQDDIDLTYQILINLGFTKSLDYYLDKIEKDNILYYEKNNIKEFMPRYFIGNNLDYMKKLFNILKTDNENIYNLTKDIIYELSTPEIFKKYLFESNYKNKLDELLYDDNLELKVYIYDIIITLFNDESNYERNIVIDFIKNNLDKIINEFNKINKNENGDNIINIKQNSNLCNLCNKKQYIRYYSSIIQLLSLCFKNFVERNELNDYIEQFAENKNIEKNLNIIKLKEDNQNLIKKIDLTNLLYTILNNMILMDKLGNINQIKIINSSKLIIYILLLISNYYEENKKFEIYKTFFKNQMDILLNCTSNELSKNIFIMSKLILSLMKEEENELFMKSQNEAICKCLKDYQQLNLSTREINDFFDLFRYLYDIFKNIQNNEMFELFENILNIILDENIILKKGVIEGYLKVINKIINILKDKLYAKICKYNFDNLITKFINEYLITFEKDKKILINEFDNNDDYNLIIMTIYKILTAIIEIDPEKYILTFFENENIKNLREKYLTKIEEDKNNYLPEEERSYTFVGLYNPSALCYINSVIQLFYNIILFRNTILSLPTDQNLNPDIDNDNFFFQLQKMFYNLRYSIKKYYNPKSFVLSFKDSQGKSPDLNEQCDAQEFLLRFIEKVNESLNNTKNKYLCQNIFGGNTLQQVKCTNPECGNISERRDNINYLSIEIKDKRKLKDCLDGFISEEKIEDYHCEKCDKKITHIKQVLIDQIPNILIIHLQRFIFDYNYFKMQKLNTPVIFEETLNIKNYTVDRDNNNIPLEYFDYELQGTLIHSGEHQYGHYYSLVYNKGENIFYEFNDMNISEIDYNTGMNLSFGQIGNSNNAYMLIYAKKNKNPIIINNKKIDEKMQKKLEENNNMDKIEMDGKIYYIYENEKEVIKKNMNLNSEVKNIIIKGDKSEAELIKYNDALNILSKENVNLYDTKPFIDKILSENIRLKNDANFYTEQFTIFINEITNQISNEIIIDDTKQKIIKYLPALKNLNDFIINIISVSKEKELLPIICGNLLEIYGSSKNKELLSYLLKYIDQMKENIFKNYLVSKDRIKGGEIGKYIAKIICISINNNIEIELSNKIIKFFIGKIPIEITKKWLDMESFNKFICYLIENSDFVKRYFIKNHMIAKLIDFILGKSSPLYKGDRREEFVKTKGYFEPIVKGIALLFGYYENNILDEDLILSNDDITLIKYSKFYDKIRIENYGEISSCLLLDNKTSLDLSLSIKENKPINDEDTLDYLINKKIEKVKTDENIISYLELLINILKKYSTLYLNKDNEIFTEKLNILLGIPIPTVNNGDAKIKYISGKYYDKFTILTNVSEVEKINKEILKIIYLLFDLLNMNELVFYYVDKLPAPNSLKYSLVDYILKFYLLNKEELEKIEHDKIALNKLSITYNDIIKRYNKNNLDDVSIENKLFFADFGYELKNNENIELYEMNIKYETIKDPKKTNLEVFNKTTYFSSSKDKNKNEIKLEGSHFNNLVCVLIYCHDDLDITLEFKPYFNSKLEIKGKKNMHYIFYCMNEEKKIDYSNLKINSKLNLQPIQQQQVTEVQSGNIPQETKFLVQLPEGMKFLVNCEVCGVMNYITNQTTEYKCSFCECPLKLNIQFL